MPSRTFRPWAARFALTALLALPAGATTSGADQEAGTFTGPWDLAALRQVPKVTVVDQGKTVASLYYEGEPYRGRPTRVFAYLARPEKAR